MEFPGNAKFITFEGSEGSGKSTNIAHACTLLEENGIDYVLTREPGGTLIAEQIREILLAKSTEPLSAVAELLLIFAARAQHLSQKILPALQAGKWVICDRFTDATYAYQGLARKLGVEQVALLEELVQNGLRPHHTFLLDVDVEIGRERAAQRGELDRFEQESTEFFERVRAAYLKLASQNPDRFIVIDAGRELEAVKTELGTRLRSIIQ